MEIDTNDFVVPVDGGGNYSSIWLERLNDKIKKAKDGDVLIVRSGLQKAFAAVEVSNSGKRITIIKRG